MKCLLNQLWFQSDNCSLPIQNMGIQISEVSKFTAKPNTEIIKYLNHLIEKKCIRNLSMEPLLYEFTEIGKKIKSDDDIEKLIKKH